MRIKSHCLFIILMISSHLFSQSNFTKYYNEAAINIDEQKYSAGIDKISKALEYKNEVKNNYKIADAYMYRGYCRYMLKNFSSAHGDIDEAIKIKPEYNKPYYFKTLVYMSEKKYSESIIWCDKGLEQKPGDPDLLLNKAKTLFSLKKYNDVNHVLHQILENDSKNVEAIRYLGSSFQQQKMYDSSIVYFSKALEINPLDFISYYDRGISKSHKHEYTSAKEDIEKAMQLDSLSKQIGYNNLGFFLKLEQQDYKGALGFFNKALEIDPKFAYAYSNRGFAKLKLGDIKGAYKDIKKSIELMNTNSYAYKNLALVFLADDKKSNACENLKKAVELGYSEEYDDEVDKLLKENCK